METAVVKYGNHPNIIAVTEKMKKLGNHTFAFHFTSYEKTVKEVNNLKISKVFQKTERLMYNQIYTNFQRIFSKFQCEFWKGFNA